MACDQVIDSFEKEDGTLDVSTKYLQLMQDSLSEDSLYMRAKNTMKVIFDDLEVSAPEKARLQAEYVSQVSINLSSVAMQTALSWSKEERDGGYTLAKVKADTEVSIANAKKTKNEICLVEKQTDLQCANIISTLSGTTRENGTYQTDADGCQVTSLEGNGLKYNQTLQVQAATYQSQADTYRKSGVVQIGIDDTDNILKGLSAPIEAITSGYTNQQTLNAERQRVAYEDSKVNHAANSAAAMIGNMLGAEVAPQDVDVQRWRNAMDRLTMKGENMSDIPDDYQAPS